MAVSSTTCPESISFPKRGDGVIEALPPAHEVYAAFYAQYGQEGPDEHGREICLDRVLHNERVTDPRAWHVIVRAGNEQHERYRRVLPSTNSADGYYVARMLDMSLAAYTTDGAAITAWRVTTVMNMQQGRAGAFAIVDGRSVADPSAGQFQLDMTDDAGRRAILSYDAVTGNGVMEAFWGQYFWILGKDESKAETSLALSPPDTAFCPDTRLSGVGALALVSA